MSSISDQKIFQRETNPLNVTMDSRLSMKSLKDGISSEELKNYFLHSYQTYEKLFTYLSEKHFYQKPEPLRHPLIFYYGHTAAFYINKLLDKGLITQRVNPQMETVFAVGVDEMDWDDLDQSHYNWPKLAETKAYRNKVKKIVLRVIQNIQSRISWLSNAWIILMGIQHEKIHLQTSSVIIRRIPIEQINPLIEFIDCPIFQTETQSIPQNKMKTVSAYHNKWQRQNNKNADYYGWDNEFGERQINVAQFSMSTMLVSNGQYLQFVKEKGYQNQEYWDEQGRAWIKSKKPKYPLFWIKFNDNFFLKTMNKVMPLPIDWPVEVNNLEATAFCNWKSSKTGKKIRLPTEDQYMALREVLPEDHFQWQHGSVGNINMQKWFSPNPVNMFETNGFYDVIGNVWQHCCTPIYPFKGFQIHPVYEDFTTPTFDGRHFMIKGGSFVSCGNQSFKYSRYAFRRHFHQFAGFRYVESQVQPQMPSVLIDQNDNVVDTFINLHYNQSKSYVQRLIEILKEDYLFPKQKFLNVGCSVGSIVLQMSKHFEQGSYGTDFSARFFQIATRILQKGGINYKNLTIQDIKFKKQNVFLYQFNPLNPDPNKINGFKVAVLDGFVIRPNTILEALKRVLALMIKNSYLILVTSPQKNTINLEEIKTIAGEFEVKKQQTVRISQFGQQVVNICVLKVNIK